jgi:hypothetical protein
LGIRQNRRTLPALRRTDQANQTGAALQFLLRDLPKMIGACARVSPARHKLQVITTQPEET